MANLGCVNKAKTAFAEETGRIAAMIERELMTGAPEYFINRIPETMFDTSMGAGPRTLRVQTVPPMRTEYQPILAPGGNESRNYVDPQTGRVISSTADKTGAACYIPGETIYWGYKEFGRCLRATALETDPICVLDVLEKKAVGATIQKLRESLPMYAKEHFGNELRRQVIRNSYRKYSVVDGFPVSTNVPYFPAIPQGGASIPHIRRIENVLRREGWDKGSRTPTVNGRPALQVLMGRDDIEFAIKSYKRQEGIQIQQGSFTVDDPTFGTTEVHNGIQFIEDPLPTKGYIVTTAPGLYEFREIQPVFVEAGTEGLITTVNPDYNKSFISVDGGYYPVVSVGYIIHPRAMERQAMGAIPKIDGKPGTKMFNFEVNLVDDWAITADPRCNKDKLYVQYRLTHAYAPLPYNPELMTAFIFLSANPEFICVRPNSQDPTPPSEPVAVQPFDPPKEGGCLACDTDSANDSRLAVTRTCTDLYPANGAGVIGFSQLAYDVQESAGNLTVVVVRTGGSVGAASVVVTPTAGTATSPANFTAGSPVTLNWADGTFGKKSIVIPINTAVGDDSGKQFTVVLSSVSGATLSSNTTATVTILDPDEAA